MVVNEDSLEILNSAMQKYGAEFLLTIISTEEESQTLYSVAQICASLNKEDREAIAMSISKFVRR
jgi:hypothetical protein